MSYTSDWVLCLSLNGKRKWPKYVNCINFKFFHLFILSGKKWYFLTQHKKIMSYSLISFQNVGQQLLIRDSLHMFFNGLRHLYFYKVATTYLQSDQCQWFSIFGFSFNYKVREHVCLCVCMQVWDVFRYRVWLLYNLFAYKSVYVANTQKKY